MLVHPMAVDNITMFDYPINLLQEGTFSAIPLMVGFTKDEGAMIGEQIGHCFIVVLWHPMHLWMY